MFTNVHITGGAPPCTALQVYHSSDSSLPPSLRWVDLRCFIFTLGAASSCLASNCSWMLLDSPWFPQQNGGIWREEFGIQPRLFHKNWSKNWSSRRLRLWDVLTSPWLFLLHSACQKQAKTIKFVGKLIQYKPKLCAHPTRSVLLRITDIQSPASSEISRQRKTLLSQNIQAHQQPRLFSPH